VSPFWASAAWILVEISLWLFAQNPRTVTPPKCDSTTFPQKSCWGVLTKSPFVMSLSLRTPLCCACLIDSAKLRSVLPLDSADGPHFSRHRQHVHLKTDSHD
jgi:hypothetical protein